MVEKTDKMRILLTGCAGFIGSNISKRLLKDDHYVIGIDNFSFGDRRNISEGLYLLTMDFNDIDNRILNDFDILIHCATSNIIYSM